MSTNTTNVSSVFRTVVKLTLRKLIASSGIYLSQEVIEDVIQEELNNIVFERKGRKRGMLIVTLYQDTIKEGPHKDQVNEAHPWWAELTNGSKRPATDSEVVLWQELQAAKSDHQGACELAWDLYSAAMGVDIKSFDGVPSPGPVEAVKAERARLIEEAGEKGDFS